MVTFFPQVMNGDRKDYYEKIDYLGLKVKLKILKNDDLKHTLQHYSAADC